MDKVQESKEALLEALRQSDECRHYEACKARIREYPEKLHAMNRFREKNYQYQSSGEAGSAEVMQMLLNEREDLIKDPLIEEYLEAELAFCRLLQSVCGDIMQITDLQLYE